MPGIVLLCDTGLFQAFNRQRGKETLPKATSQNGEKSRNLAPEPKRRVNLPMVPPGGFSRGEQFERERVAPPLSRLLCLLSCRGKKVRPCWQALVESRLKNRLKGYKRVTMTSSKYQSKSKPSVSRPLAPSVTATAVPAPSRRELWGAYHFTLACCFLESASCRIPQSRLRRASSLLQGSLRGAPGGNAHDNLLQIVTAPPVPGNVTGWKSRQRTKAPLVKGGWFGEAKPGGFRRLAGFHIGLFYRKVPAVNPSVTAAPCQLPLAREPFFVVHENIPDALCWVSGISV